MITYEDMKDRVAVVTGAASGIGKATAEEFAQNGAIARIYHWELYLTGKTNKGDMTL